MPAVKVFARTSEINVNFGKSLFNDGLCVIIICSALMWVIWTVRENEDIRGVKENEKEKSICTHDGSNTCIITGRLRRIFVR